MNPDLMARIRQIIGKKALDTGANFPLSGGRAPFQYTPSPAPNVPFQPGMPPAPQMIPRGGNLGLPSAAPIAIDPGNNMPNYAPIPGQNPNFNQAPGTTQMAAAQGRAFNPGLFNLGLQFMQRGGSKMAPMAQMLPSIFALGKK